MASRQRRMGKGMGVYSSGNPEGMVFWTRQVYLCQAVSSTIIS